MAKPPVIPLDSSLHPTDDRSLPDSDRLAEDRSERRLALSVGLLFAAMTTLAALDIVFDALEKLSFPHTLVELGIVLVGLSGVASMARRLLRSIHRQRRLLQHTTELVDQLESTRREMGARADELAARLEATEREAQRWKREAGALLEGLGAAIDAQFQRWGLTRAERDIGLLLLKGLSHKEIAQLRKVSEATVRQQAQALYRKAHISSRSDLSAFFLRDLLLPADHERAEPTTSL